MSALAAKILGGILCLFFVATLKPILGAFSRRMPAMMHHYFMEELGHLGPQSPVPSGAWWVIGVGLIAWLGVGLAIETILDGWGVLVGALAGLSTLYFFFFMVLVKRAKKRWFAALRNSRHINRRAS